MVSLLSSMQIPSSSSTSTLHTHELENEKRRSCRKNSDGIKYSQDGSERIKYFIRCEVKKRGFIFLCWNLQRYHILDIQSFFFFLLPPLTFCEIMCGICFKAKRRYSYAIVRLACSLYRKFVFFYSPVILLSMCR